MCSLDITLVVSVQSAVVVLHRSSTVFIFLELCMRMQDTWRDMEALVDAGLVRSIGLSNFSTKKLDDVLSYARIPPAVVQVPPPLVPRASSKLCDLRVGICVVRCHSHSSLVCKTPCR